MKFESNPDIPLELPQFSWKQGFSPVIHLSAVDLYNRGGSAGSIDANLDASFTEINHGKGRIFLAAEPVELAESDQATADIYSYVASRVGIQPQFELATPLSPGVMAYPITLEDSVLYVFVSDNAENANIDLQDKAAGVQIKFNLQAERAALALVGKKEKAVIAKYGF